jgi:Xaa-Pro aminopeptidase
MAALIRERGWGRRRIGLEMDGYYFSPRAQQTLVAELPEATFADAGTLVNWVRIVKSPQELEYIGQAAQIVEKVMQAAIDAVAVGVRQCDVAATIYQAQMAGTAEFGGAYTSSPPFIPTGKNSSAPHLMWTDARYEPGETTPMELVACRHRYHAPIGRTVFLGTPPADVLRVAEGVVEGLTAALEAIRPGVVCEEVEAVWRKTAARFGIEKPSRLGYSFGVAYPPTWGDRTLSLRPGDRTVLEPGMTLHVIPGIWLADWGVVITESIRVTENGCQPLCNLPRTLFVKE